MADSKELTRRAVELLNKRKETYLVLNEEIHLLLLRQSFPSELTAALYEPALCLILQGRKEITTAQRSFSFRKFGSTPSNDAKTATGTNTLPMAQATERSNMG